MDEVIIDGTMLMAKFWLELSTEMIEKELEKDFPRRTVRLTAQTISDLAGTLISAAEVDRKIKMYGE